MNKSDYHKYLASREWALLKNKVQKRCNGKCERCFVGEYEATHHLTYERIGHEDLEDLQGVCSVCHEFLSGKSSFDRGSAFRMVTELTDCLPGSIEYSFDRKIITAHVGEMDGTPFEGFCVSISVHSSEPGTYAHKTIIKE
jgi:hypothetical protein